MSILNNDSILTKVHISEIKIGSTLVNLGRILEKKELPDHYSLVIDRWNEKQVFKFTKQEFLFIL